MKTRPDRYAVPVSVQSYEKMQSEVAQRALRDGAVQGIAVCMMALEMAYGWRKGRLTGFYAAVDEILHMPPMLGKTPTAEDAIGRMRELYHIDLDKLDIAADPDFERGKKHH